MDTGQMLKVEDAVDRMIAGIEQIEKPLAISKEPQWSFTASM
jgi:hypothetical protein